MTPQNQPWGWAIALLRRWLPDGPNGESVRADLEQEFQDVTREKGRSAARRWHAWEALKMAGHFMWARGVRGMGTSRGGGGMEGFGSSFGMAWRALVRAPGFAALAVFTMALGIGANVAMFSIVDAVLLDPLPYDDPDELVAIWERHVPRDRRQNVANPGNYKAWSDRSESFERMTAVSMAQPMTVLVDDRPDEAMVQLAEDTFFDVLGVDASLGRTFLTDASGGDATEAVLSAGYWRERFGGDPGVIGRTFTVNGRPAVVVGVTDDYVVHGDGTDLWMSRVLTVGDQTNSGRWLQVVGRLADGSTLSAAEDEMTAIAAGLQDEFPDFNAGWDVELIPLRTQIVGDVQRALWVLLGAVALLLVIACSNVANLFLVRATERQREMAVRTALGATGGRLAGQLITESLLIAGAGAALGIGLAHLGTGLVAARIPDAFPLPRLASAGVDGPVLLFAVAVTVGTGLLFGLLPALQAARTAPAGTLNAEARGPSRRTGRIRNGLVIAEVAVSAMLLVGAALFGRSFSTLNAVDPGIDAASVLVGRVNLAGDTYAGDAPKVAFFETLIGELAGAPDVEAVGGITFLPMNGSGAGTSVWPADRPAPEAENRRAADIRNIAGDYFGAMSIELLQGRAFDTRDRADAPPTVVVNRAMAERYWPDGNAVGASIVINWGELTEWEIVGIVEDVRLAGLAVEPREVVYMSYARATYFPWLHLAVKARQDPAALAETVRRATAAQDPGLPVGGVRVMQDIVSISTATPRVTALLMAVFAGLATLLAAVGLYGVLSYAVSRRVREIGVRVALGARSGDVLGLVVRQGGRLALAGLAVGLLGSMLGGRVLSSLLYGIAPSDPVATAGAGVLLLVVALTACGIPAWRAVRVAPVEALKGD